MAHIKEILTEERITYKIKREVSEHCFEIRWKKYSFKHDNKTKKTFKKLSISTITNFTETFVSNFSKNKKNSIFYNVPSAINFSINSIK